MTHHLAPPPRPARGTPSRLGPIAAATLLALAIAACTAGGASPSATLAPDPAPPTRAPVPSLAPPTEPAEGAVPQAVIDAAVADAAGRAGVDPSAITVVSAEAHSWPNGALGCPEPGMMYTQAITPGYQVVVEAGGTEYDYRASARSGDVSWCENPLPMR